MVIVESKQTVALACVGLFFLTGLLACEPGSTSERTADTAATAARDTMAIHRADSLAGIFIARTDSVLDTIQPLSSSDLSALRQYRQDDHLARARRYGIEGIPDRRRAGELMAQSDSESGLVEIRTNTYYIVDPRMGYAVPMLVPSAARMVDRIGRQFQADLAAAGLPPYRFILTNVLRTDVDQAQLRGTNVNAARGESVHQLGTTVDIYYGRFHYAAEADTAAQRAAGANDADRHRLTKQLRDSYREVGLARAETLRGILGRALIRLQDERIVMARYESQEPVFHVTLARPIEAPALEDAPSPTPWARLYAELESHLVDIEADIEDLESPADLRRHSEGFWSRLSAIDTEAPTSEEMADLIAEIARLEADIRQVELSNLTDPSAAAAFLKRRLRDADRAISFYVGLVQDSDQGEHVEALRRQYDELSTTADHLEGSGNSVRTTARSQTRRQLADLTANLHLNRYAVANPALKESLIASSE